MPYRDSECKTFFSQMILPAVISGLLAVPCALGILFLAAKKKSHPAEQIKGATALWRNVEPYSPAAERLLADAVLEFYGIRRNNPELKEFLERQCWYPAPERPIDPELKERLLKAGTTEAPSGETQK